MSEHISPKPTVFFVDDDADIRALLGQIVATRGLASVGFERAQEFLDAFKPGAAGCLILDIQLPGMSGLELQHELRVRRIDIPIIIITGAGDIEMARNAFKSGVVDFVTKPFRPAELLESIDRALARDAENRRVREVVVEAERRFSKLSAREREVVDLLVAGKSTKEIAYHLSLSPKTVDVHRANSMRKIGVGSIAELVHLAVSLAPGQSKTGPHRPTPSNS
ncbi:MAG: response regulator transcription factor [Phycisphaerae bacterium]|nr:response regulator transcription factor [Phycisphaerae bacterium]